MKLAGEHPHLTLLLLMISTFSLCGCYAPMRSPGIPASSLPDSYRLPLRTSASPLNFGHLVAESPRHYLLDTGDQLTVLIPDLDDERVTRPLMATVQENGVISLPRVGTVQVKNLTLLQAQQQVNSQLVSTNILRNPSATVSLEARGTVKVVVLGEVERPGVYELPRYENDIAHAIAVAGGFTENADDLIEVHRKTQATTVPQFPTTAPQWGHSPPYQTLPQPILPGVPLSKTNSSKANSHTRPPLQRNANRIQTVSYRSHPENRQPVQLGSYRENSQQRVFPSQRGMPGSPQFGAGSPPEYEMRTNPQYPGATPHYQMQSSHPYGNRTPPQYQMPPSPQYGMETTPQYPMQREAVPDPSLIQSADQPILRIPLRGNAAWALSEQQKLLNSGDVIKVPTRKSEVFYVVGPLSEVNRVRFNVGDRDREIGNGFLLPKDREVDVITAVAMAGYIDPITSPTTVTVHRSEYGMQNQLIHLDLIKARENPQENILVRAGDIIYLNPDPAWYFRRTFDGTLNTLLGRLVPNR